MRRSEMFRTVAVAAIALALADSAQTKVGPMSLDEMIDASVFVGVVEVREVSRSFPLVWRQAAEANVLDEWVGSDEKVVKYLASPTWMCDTSSATVGERVLLFLVVADTIFDSQQIAHSGRGRLNIVQRGGLDFVRVSDVALPASLMPASASSEWSSHIEVPVSQVREVRRRTPE